MNKSRIEEDQNNLNKMMLDILKITEGKDAYIARIALICHLFTIFKQLKSSEAERTDFILGYLKELDEQHKNSTGHILVNRKPSND